MTTILLKNFKRKLSAQCKTQRSTKHFLYESPKKKEKKRKENRKTITYKITFIDSVSFTSNSLSKLPGKFVKGLHKDKYKNSSLENVAAKDTILILSQQNGRKL